MHLHMISCDKCQNVISNDEEYFSLNQTWAMDREEEPHTDEADLCRACYEVIFKSILPDEPH